MLLTEVVAQFVNCLNGVKKVQLQLLFKTRVFSGQRVKIVELKCNILYDLSIFELTCKTTCHFGISD